MDHSTLKTLCTTALDEAGIFSAFDTPEESIDLEHMDRRYFIRLGFRSGPSEPFTTSCELSWRWRALHSAWTATTEEDLLTELNGREEWGELSRH